MTNQNYGNKQQQDDNKKMSGDSCSTSKSAQGNRNESGQSDMKNAQKNKPSSESTSSGDRR